MKTGTVMDVSIRSLVYFTDNENGKKYIAPFSKIRGYNGEMSEVPLVPGVSVSFNLDDTGRVTEVVIPRRQKRRKTISGEPRGQLLVGLVLIVALAFLTIGYILYRPHM